MHDDRALVEGRLERALDQFVRPAVHPEWTGLAVSAWHAPGEPVPVAEALRARYEPFAPGTAWGSPWSTSWFRIEGEVPREWAGRRVEVLIDPGFAGDGPGFQAEGLVYDADGVPVKGVHPLNRHVPVAAPARGGEPVRLLLEAAANPAVLRDGFRPTRLGDVLTAGDEPLYRFGYARLAVRSDEVWHLVLDVEVLSELMRELSPDDPRRHEILRALEFALDALDLHDVPGTAADARAELAGVLSRPAHASAHRLSAVGHAHIDSAWLWPLRETVRKASRTFANVTQLATEYPELVFACSQAQQYAWVKEHQPHIWRRIKEAVASGNWAPVGSMWVESDANMPGGEALVRQITHGKRFFREEFGVETEEIWLPDSFGYTAAFPQLAKLAGIRWFLTQKLSWNQSNRMPHHTFWWEGIDGSRVFTHFPPVDTYNSGIRGSELARAVRQFAEKGLATRSLVPFGHGDGGGGPTREMLEKARRTRSLEGSPRVEVESPSAFFTAAEREYGQRAPVWSGEMYLELHRATYTTQAATKRGNRRSEHLLREAELWATTAALADSGYSYPYDDLDRLWKTVLLHQFHDILPGSSIAWVHREARETYERVRRELESLVADAVRVIAPAGAPVVFNASPYARSEPVTLPDGRTAWAAVPALGAAVAGEAPGDAWVRATTAADGGHVLENAALRVVVDRDGLLSSVRDKAAEREALAPGTRGNLLQLHPDHPNKWDAWDIDRHYRRRGTDLTDAESVELTEDGPLRAVVRVVRLVGDGSRVTQDIVLRAGARRVDIDTVVDWHESEKVLKAAFPLDVQAEQAASEIQFGHVQRPTHANTGWDAARFETCAHRWVRVAEPDYGIALLNDSTYGHDVTRAPHAEGVGTTVRLTLLRAPHSPDPETDQGVHRFGYALLPGADTGDAVAEGLAVNLPLRVSGDSPSTLPRAPGIGGVEGLIGVDDPAVTVEAVKQADDRSGDVVVRLYESRGTRVTATLTTRFPVPRADVTDLLERPLRAAERAGVPADGQGAAFALRLRPFQILTLRLAVAHSSQTPTSVRSSA
ncbi:glycoside hydrolase family 38 C-terminal domain-containing protein [Streptomyces sp. ICBB 8177]|uniref:alpha-mannosidase n=1 Tax=Streptomyces sp. ICBB 8177 TaxID=563922 RepID=UPI000D67E88A|nr:glycoside hydrolase family 38 C-terminal domain-containing protein [Streptomyces sp. ICBB 8177]PWI41411.1 alpha-mannosidase [Streptomyces sp. ICBB 8177]